MPVSGLVSCFGFYSPECVILVRYEIGYFFVCCHIYFVVRLHLCFIEKKKKTSLFDCMYVDFATLRLTDIHTDRREDHPSLKDP